MGRGGLVRRGVRPALSDGWEKQRNWKTLIFWNIEQQRRNDHPHQMVTIRTRHQTQVYVKLKINQNDKDKTVTYHDKHIGTGQDSHDDNVLVNVTT